MTDHGIIWACDLARRLGIDEEAVYELARLRPLPFAISSAAPRQLCIDADHLPLWRAAIAACSDD